MTNGKGNLVKNTKVWIYVYVNRGGTKIICGTTIIRRKATVPKLALASTKEDEKFHNAIDELLLLAQIDSIGSNIT